MKVVNLEFWISQLIGHGLKAVLLKKERGQEGKFRMDDDSPYGGKCGKIVRI